MTKKTVNILLKGGSSLYGAFRGALLGPYKTALQRKSFVEEGYSEDIIYKNLILQLNSS